MTKLLWILVGIVIGIGMAVIGYVAKERQEKSGELIYLVREIEDAPYLYLKEDFKFSELQKGIAPLIFTSWSAADNAKKLVDRGNELEIIATDTVQLSSIISTLRAVDEDIERKEK